MTSNKISFGIRINEDLTQKLDEIVKNSKFLSSTRAELIESILHAFFKSKLNHLEKGRELIIIKRKDYERMSKEENLT